MQIVFCVQFFTIIIIQYKVSFSSHSSSSHYSMQGFVFIIIPSFWGGFIVNIKDMTFEMRACFLILFQNEYECGYMLKSIVLGSFYHPFQDGYLKFRKTGIVSITRYLILDLPSAVFSVCQNHYQMLVFCWHVFWQIHKFQIHKLVSRCEHLNISTMYSVFDWTEF